MIRKIKFSTIFFTTILLLALVSQNQPALAEQHQVTSPEAFFGFQMGSDGKIARWNKIVDYFKLLEKESDKVKVINMGPSTMGHPFLLVIITSKDNLANLENLRQINAKISDPQGVTEKELKNLVGKGKAVICQSMSLHATEIGGTQMTPELTYQLATSTDKETKRILDNVIFCMIPCFNPDGQIMVTDWYKKTKGTEYEGTGLPWLYHKYVGHDNNRDGDYLNMIESKYAAKIMYRDWIPQAYIDHHHMGSYGARFYIPPYCDPIRPYADPLIWREHAWYGAHIAYKLEEKGKQGILNAAQFPGWGHFGWHWITPFHNISGMLTESASAKLATPIYIHPDQLRAGDRQFPEYKAQSTFPSPWPGGWWRLRDIVEQKKISALALLDLAARNKETVLYNAFLKARHQTQRGETGLVKAYVIPREQHDPLTTVKMINTLLLSGVQIQKATKDFTVGLTNYPDGSYLVSLAQPKMGLIRNLLGETHYPDNQWTRNSEGFPLRPYDLATHTMNEFMGVCVQPIESVPKGEFEKLTGPVKKTGTITPGEAGYVLDGRLNDSFRAANMLMAQGIEVHRLDREHEGLRPGDFILPQVEAGKLKKIARETGVDFKPLTQKIKTGIHKITKPRIGMYQRYYGGNMDEGWTRFVLEQFDFSYTSLKDREIEKGNLNKQYDVIILPHDNEGMITGNIPQEYRRYISTSPPEYRSGINKKGIAALKHFVKNGGRLVTLGDACQFAINKFELNVKNTLAKKNTQEFFCPGSTLRARFETNHPLAYGMPNKGLVLYFSDPAFVITPSPHNERYKTIVRYEDKDLLRSGWLIGEKHIANKGAVVIAEYEKGQVVLLGIRVQHRSQTHGTFKLLFNSLLN